MILFLTVSFSGWFSNSKMMGIHPFTLILFITLFTFLAGVFGFSGVRDWKGMARSVFSIIVTLSLSAFLGCVLLFGSLFN